MLQSSRLVSKTWRVRLNLFGCLEMKCQTNVSLDHLPMESLAYRLTCNCMVWKMKGRDNEEFPAIKEEARHVVTEKYHSLCY